MKLLKHYSTEGLAFKASHDFTKTAKAYLDNVSLRRSHMRIGQFAVIVFHGLPELIAAEAYDKDNTAHRLPRTSRWWEMSKADRLHQITVVESKLAELRSEGIIHPLAGEILAECADERNYLK